MKLKIWAAAFLISVPGFSVARASNSYPMADGVSRAPAMTLHCVSGNGVAVACGTASLPLVASGAVTANPVVGQPVSRSTVVAAQQSVQLFPANSTRHYLAFQAPIGTSIWVNFLGGPASGSGQDCVYFPAGTLYESGPFVTKGAVFIYSPVAGSISAWEG